MSHLSENAQLLLQLRDEERIEKILSERWIGYGRAKNILENMEFLLKHPRITRMPNLLLVGPTNNGKTLLLSKFFTIHKPVITATDRDLKVPVLYVQAPPKPDQRAFFSMILDKLNVPHRIYERVERKLQQVLTILRAIENKVLIVDEIHHILAGNATTQRTFLNVLKFLGNELQIVIIGAGTKDAYNAINTDPQLANRFEPAVLPRWQLNDEYFRLLVSFEMLLPLKNPSNLSGDYDLAVQILTMSEGLIGEIATILKKAAVMAIETKTECITKNILSAINYVSPSDRRREFESLSL